MKIFGIGWHRTGTKTLSIAMKMLGYKVCHCGGRIYGRVYRNANKVPSTFWKEYDFFDDLPIPYFFRELSNNFPRAKFILVTRSLDSWLNSCKSLYALRSHKWSKDLSSFQGKIYGSRQFDAQKMAATYLQHNEDVLNFFDGKDNFLHLDLHDIGWNKLCHFLGKPIPLHAFPHEHKSTKKSCFMSAKRFRIYL